MEWLKPPQFHFKQSFRILLKEKQQLLVQLLKVYKQKLLMKKDKLVKLGFLASLLLKDGLWCLDIGKIKSAIKNQLLMAGWNQVILVSSIKKDI